MFTGVCICGDNERKKGYRVVKISVIIPTYNRRDMIKSAIESVFRQSWRDYELIIVDDASGDGTGPWIRQTYHDRLKYIMTQHSGVSHARNIGISHAQGEFIAFLDSDDYWLEHKLQTQMDQMIANPHYLISHTQEKWFRNGVFLNQKKIHQQKGGDLFRKSLKMCSIGMSTVMVRKNLFCRVGLFDESFPACEDYDLWLRATSKYFVLLIPEALTVKHGGHPDQLSHQYPLMDQFRIRSIVNLIESASLTESQRQCAEQELDRKGYVLANGCFKRNKRDEGNSYIQLIKKYCAKTPFIDRLT